MMNTYSLIPEITYICTVFQDGLRKVVRKIGIGGC